MTKTEALHKLVMARTEFITLIPRLTSMYAKNASICEEALEDVIDAMRADAIVDDPQDDAPEPLVMDTLKPKGK